MAPQFEPTDPINPPCQVLGQDRYQYLHCTFQPLDSAANNAVCMHIKRAAKVETPTELVALIVRWAEMDRGNCPIDIGAQDLALPSPIQ
jgi:hypothetical protein